ncbi:unnamed protein product [Hyaloperonospora brassicae]|uniref:HTH CENPB-type domain-containing protein n=1 Tax=Hyaloperonospora brassicae TaxID=162125 RepID=A0AAV0U760_HYABA|nr:unnamed protein product [Hyaloperonospora brassicae]
MTASGDERSGASDTPRTCRPSSALHEDVSSPTLALLAAPDAPFSPPSDAANVTALRLERCASELLEWLARAPVATSLPDEALFFFETQHPEILTDLPLLFAWLSLFVAQHERSSGDRRAVGANPTVVEQYAACKSTLTPLFDKHESERLQGTELRAEDAATSGRRPQPMGAQAETELLQWVLARRHVALTRQDILNHVMEAYPVFAASKSAAALKVWTARFVKKHIGPHVEPVAESAATEAVGTLSDGRTETAAGNRKAAADGDVAAAAAAAKAAIVDAMDADYVGASDVGEAELCLLVPQAPFGPETLETREEAGLESAATTGRRHTGKRRSCARRYMLFSNEFKLHAVHMVEQGKSVAEVSKELGLKSSNCLNYWRSIRDKLVTAERKRFRLAGGGRRSSCTFEDELLTWVSQRHQRGQGTDAKAVLEYIKQYHSTFTEGKKEPTLRKWILRFFKRCWRAPCPSMDSQDAEKAYIFV